MAAGLLGLGACSSSDSTKEVAPGGLDLKAEGEEAEKQPYPNLGNVPDRPPVSTPDQRIIIEEGLLADRANARHIDLPSRWASGDAAAATAGGTTAAASPRTPVAEVPATGPSQVASAASPVTAGAAQAATIIFAENAATLPPGSESVLQQVATAHKARGGSVRVVGHTSSRPRSQDPEKDKLAKFELSLARANAVATALANLGVARSRIVIAGRADTEPAAAPEDGAGAAENKRVDIYLDR